MITSEFLHLILKLEISNVFILKYDVDSKSEY